MEPKRDFYEVLGLSRNADERAIRDAFRQLALKYHPDRNKSPGAEERFKEIAEAYAVLSDPKKRAEYDARGFGGVSGYSAEDLFGGIDFEDLFGGLGIEFGFGPGGSLFEQLFFGGRNRARRPRRGMNLETELQVSLETVLRGAQSTVRLSVPGESGAREISLHVPPGVEDGMALRVPGRGMQSRTRGGPPGDLFVVIRVLPDRRFMREGSHLWTQVSIPVTDAVLGSRVAVSTLEGESVVTIPEGTQPDTILRLRGKGLPELGRARRGDLLVRLAVEIPERLSSEERALYERLRRTRKAA